MNSKENDVLALAQSLIRMNSVTPNDAGIQTLLAERLQKLGFDATRLRIGGVDNIWLKHGDTPPVLTFAGHTDVVPPGPLSSWKHDPFSATLENGYLYGRGAADMKGGLAAMSIAIEQFVQKNPDHPGTISFLLTSDEEGIAINGTRAMIDYLYKHQTQIDWCILGEPSSQEVLADTIRIGRRGSLNVKLTIHGKQGHVAYPEQADNPIHRVLPFLNKLIQIKWDQGNTMFDRTSLQIANVNGGIGVNNVIPETITISFNLRYAPTINADKIKQQIIKLIETHQLSYDVDWDLSGLPFLTSEGKLLDTACNAIQQICQHTPAYSTGGGTSDGRFIAPKGVEVIELGPINKTIHKPNECVRIGDLYQLVLIYERILENIYS